jgi:hypothetical protein
MPPPGGDDDRDGVPNGRDNCPRDENPSQRDADADGTGDACDDGDTDLDGVPDRDDLCPAADLRPVDTDGDGLGDQCDNCPDVPNEGQVDVDGDGRGDACEDLNDLDEDGVPLGTDNCENLANSDQLDADGDGRGDACDGCPNAPDFSQRDRDGDGVGDACDPCPDVGGDPAAQADFDGDGVAACAGDCDDDDPRVKPDAMERCNGGDDDCDLNVDETFVDLGAACQAGIGACQRPGVLVCGDDAGVVCNAVAGAARAEVCNEVDDDCDGRVDDGLVGCCQPGDQVACGSEVGECSPGVQVCGNDRNYGACNDVGPASEVCNNRDDDCDATTDEGFDLTTDAANCGRCGNACPDGQRCVEGGCLAGGGPLRNRLLVCGTVDRNLETLLQGANVGLRIESSCVPNARTQAMLLPRSGVRQATLNWGVVGPWIRAGGNLITEYDSSLYAYNGLTGSNLVGAVFHTGGCQNVVMPRAQRSPQDPFWQDNDFAPPPANEDGCGHPIPVAQMPGVVALGGFNANEVSLAYLDLGLGRLWLVESDWQDDLARVDLEPTDRLLAYMVAGGRNGVSPGQCNNGLDDDEDGYFDLDDRGCDTLEDAVEGNGAVGVSPRCSNDLDDDGNGAIDFPYDSGCTHANDATESPPAVMPACANGRDDDGDGAVDFPADVECQGAGGTDEDPPARFVQCNDRVDNDLDGRVDRLDEDCPVGLDLTESPAGAAAACNNRIDDDADGRADLFDPGCVDAFDQSEVNNGAPPQCGNAADDDLDGRVDYPQDPDCAASGDPCERAGALSCAGACRDIATDESHCGRCGNVCAAGDACLDGRCGGGFSTFRGVQRNIDEAELVGWRTCFSDTYAAFSPGVVESMQRDCDGDFVIYACRRVGSPTYSVLAMGERDLVFTNTGDENNVVTTTNGVSFYFSSNFSIGFVPEGQLPSRGTCDVGMVRGDERLCWHTSVGALSPGYRCGNQLANGDPTWERVVLTAP